MLYSNQDQSNSNTPKHRKLREISWLMSASNTTSLVNDVSMMALWRRGMPKGVIVHSDQVATFSSGDYQQIIKGHRLKCSMSRRAESQYKAVAKNFIGHLKIEYVDDENYRTRQEAKQSILDISKCFTIVAADIVISEE